MSRKQSSKLYEINFQRVKEKTRQQATNTGDYKFPFLIMKRAFTHMISKEPKGLNNRSVWLNRQCVYSAGVGWNVLCFYVHVYLKPLYLPNGSTFLRLCNGLLCLF